VPKVGNTNDFASPFAFYIINCLLTPRKE